VILPPAGTLVPPTPPEGQGEKPKSTKPSTEGELPGLPDDEPSPLPPKSKSPDIKPVPKESPKHSAWQLPGSRGTAVSPAGALEPVRNTLPSGAHLADPIGVTSSLSGNRVERAGYATTEFATGRDAIGRTAPAMALRGYCPVELNCNGRWVTGDLRWTVVYQGWIYRLSGAEQRQQFLADPNRFAVVNSGNDVVESVNAGRIIPGQLSHCATYNGRLYVFSSEAARAEFNKHPERYAAGK
jgi:YHS domain-containing protein